MITKYLPIATKCEGAVVSQMHVRVQRSIAYTPHGDPENNRAEVLMRSWASFGRFYNFLVAT